MRITLQPIFTSSFILFKDLGLDNDQIIKELKELSYKKINNLDKRCESSTSIKILNEIKVGQKLKEKTNLCLNIAIKDIWKYDVGHNIVNSWSTRTSPGCSSDLHVHSNFWMSAVYYPFSNGGFEISFQSDRFDLTSYDVNKLENNCFNSTSWNYEVCSGDLIIFSAGLKHKIERNDTQDTRYSIAMNILPKGIIGMEDGTLTI